MGDALPKLIWSLSAALLAVVLHLSGGMTSADLLVRDALLRANPTRQASRVAVVLIDEEALGSVGPWPWTRRQLANLVDQCFAQGAKGVAIDFLLPEAREGDEALDLALSRGPSCLAVGLDDGGRWLLPNSHLKAGNLGHVSFDLDRDGVVRHFASQKQVGDRAFPAMPVAAAQMFDDTLPTPVGLNIRPAFSSRPVPVLSATVLMEGRTASLLKGRIVFIGSGAAGVGDRFVSPVSPGGSPEPGVFLEALSSEAILSKGLLRVAPPLVNGLLCLTLAWIGMLLVASRNRVLPLLAPLVVFLPFPLAGALLVSINLETAPFTLALSLLLVGGLLGVNRARLARSAMDLAKERIAELESMQVAIAIDRKQDVEARRVVAHELKTPLTSVRGLVQLLSRFDLSPPERDRVVGLVTSETTRMAQMVDALLDLERLHLRDFSKDARILNLSLLCAERVEVLRAGTDRTLETNLEPEMHVRGDGALLDRVVENLMSNAIKFSPAGSPVRLHLKSVDDHAVIEVIDLGPGVPAAERKSIFGRFARGSSQVLAPGLGLGLALVAEVIAWHNGEVDVEANPGGGSRFRVGIPLTPSGQSD